VNGTTSPPLPPPPPPIRTNDDDNDENSDSDDSIRSNHTTTSDILKLTHHTPIKPAIGKAFTNHDEDDISMTSLKDDDDDEEDGDLMQDDDEEEEEEEVEKPTPSKSTPTSHVKRPSPAQKPTIFGLTPLETEFAWLYAESTYLQIHNDPTFSLITAKPHLNWDYITSQASPMLLHLIQTKHWNDGFTRVSAFYVRGVVASKFDEKWKEILELLQKGYRRELTKGFLPPVDVEMVGTKDGKGGGDVEESALNEMEMEEHEEEELSPMKALPQSRSSVSTLDSDNLTDSKHDTNDSMIHTSTAKQPREVQKILDNDKHEPSKSNDKVLEDKTTPSTIKMEDEEMKDEEEKSNSDATDSDDDDPSSLLIPVIPWQCSEEQEEEEENLIDHQTHTISPSSSSSSANPQPSLLTPVEQEFAQLNAESTLLQNYKTGSTFFLDWDYIEEQASPELTALFEAMKCGDRVYRVVSRFVRKLVKVEFEQLRDDILNKLQDGGERRKKVRHILPTSLEILQKKLDQERKAMDAKSSSSSSDHTKHALNEQEEELGWLLEDSMLHQSQQDSPKPKVDWDFVKQHSLLGDSMLQSQDSPEGKVDWDFVLEHASPALQQCMIEKKKSGKEYQDITAYIRIASLNTFKQRRLDIRTFLKQGGTRPSFGGSRVDFASMNRSMTNYDDDANGIISPMRQTEMSSTTTITSFYPITPPPPLPPTQPNMSGQNLTEIEEEFTWLYEESMMKSASRVVDWSFITQHATPNFLNVIQQKQKTWKKHTTVNAYIRPSVHHIFQKKRKEIQIALASGYRRNIMENILPNHATGAHSLDRHHLTDVEEEFAWLYEESIFKSNSSSCSWTYLEKNASPKLRDFIEKKKKSWKNYRVTNAFIRSSVSLHFTRRREEIRDALIKGFRREETRHLLPNHNGTHTLTLSPSRTTSWHSTTILPPLNELEEEFTWLYEESMFFLGTARCDWGFIEKYCSPALTAMMEDRKKTWKSHRFVNALVRASVNDSFRQRRGEIRKMLVDGKRREECVRTIIPDLKKQGLLLVTPDDSSTYELSSLDKAMDDKSLSLNAIEDELALLTVESCIISQSCEIDWDFIECYASSALEKKMEQTKNSDCEYRVLFNYIRSTNATILRLFQQRRLEIGKRIQEGERRDETKDAFPDTLPQSIDDFLKLEELEEAIDSLSVSTLDAGMGETSSSRYLRLSDKVAKKYGGGTPLTPPRSSSDLDQMNHEFNSFNHESAASPFSSKSNISASIDAPKELSTVEEELAWLMEESIVSQGKSSADWDFIEKNASEEFGIILKRKKATCNSKYRRCNTFVRMQNPLVKGAFRYRRKEIRTLLSRGYRRDATKHLLPKANLNQIDFTPNLDLYESPIETTRKVHGRGDKVYAYCPGEGVDERNKWLPGTILGHKRSNMMGGRGTIFYSVEFDEGNINTRLEECFAITEDEHKEKISQLDSDDLDDQIEPSCEKDQGEAVESGDQVRKKPRVSKDEEVSSLLSKMKKERERFAEEAMHHQRIQQSRTISMNHTERKIEEIVRQLL